ncbi:arylesterase [Marinomonas piezotolerans]|uniref:Arylesterase n=1 Tax=Marinomonas piezotolerans TaxID=2213058 RepID=A0A370UBW0_9GAMM|nr:SGNH/GDSL hydrolase family protein [Marinomonas piezotolerans]RDL45231.1 arylesterase [Marinomonas piezotolerans]
MATVLCYGDSLTWGSVPNGGRFPPHLRWPQMLQSLLDDKHQVINYGLPGRTTIWDDPFREGRNGLTYIQAALETFGPVKVLIIMLGTNDLKRYFNVGAYEAAKGVEKIIQRSRLPLEAGFPYPEIIVVAPPNISAPKGEMRDSFTGAEEKSQYFHQFYQNVAVANKCEFLNAAGIVEASTVDGVHLDSEANQALAEALSEKVSVLLK